MSFEADIRKFVRDEVQHALAQLLPTQEGGDYITTRQVAELTGMSVSYFEVGRHMSSPGLPPYHKVGRRVLYRRADVEAWLADRRRG